MLGILYCAIMSGFRKLGHIWAPNNVDRSIPRDTGLKSLYIYFANSHFQVVTTVRSR